MYILKQLPMVFWSLAFLFFPACSLVLDTKETPDKCGDGVVQWWETCDGTNFNGKTCESLTGTGGTLVCSSDCKLIDTTGCVAPETCGNGNVDEGEECDGDVGVESCESLGYGPGDLACSANCQFDTSGCGEVQLCGNGRLDDGEECDDGKDMDGDGCSSTCRVEAGWNCEGVSAAEGTWCEPICGDGILVVGEICDGEQGMEGIECEDHGYYPGVMNCNADCELDYSDCGGICGDGVVQDAFEECDGDGMALFCDQFGLGPVGQHLFCDPNCKLDFIDCDVDPAFMDLQTIRVGGNHTCSSDHINSPLFCWGNHEFGQVGIGPLEGHPFNFVPGPSRVFSTARLVTTGKNHTCAINDEAGNSFIRCWGRNDRGQLGVGDIQNRYNAMNHDTVVTLPSGTLPTAVFAGGEHTCAVDGAKVFCWGDNTRGQLGFEPGVETYFEYPAELPGITLEEIAAGLKHTCGINRTEDKVYCWGDNTQKQLGVDTPEYRYSPAEVVLPQAISPQEIVAGDNHTCIMHGGGMLCWGSNSHEQIRPGSGVVLTPHGVMLPGSTGVMQMAAGGNSTCAVTMPDMKLYCWGQNDFGQLGVGDTMDRSSPTEVLFMGGELTQSISISRHHACAVVTTAVPPKRQLYCWGANMFGQLGDRTRFGSPSPILIGERQM